LRNCFSFAAHVEHAAADGRSWRAASISLCGLTVGPGPTIELIVLLADNWHP
jgi:hypothetical protein